MKKILVILNGPPGSGKDTLADYLVSTSQGVWSHTMFKDILNKIVCAIYGVSPVWLYECSKDRLRKETPQEVFQGLSLREAQIFVSEKIIKPNYGKQFFGKALVSEVLGTTYSSHYGREDRNYFVVSDGGFYEEFVPIIESDEIFPILIRLHRDGHTFAGDSRQHLVYSNVELKHQYDFHNVYSSVKHFCAEFDKYLAGILKGVTLHELS